MMNLAPSTRKILIAATTLFCILLLTALAISLFTAPQTKITTNVNLTVLEDQILITHTGGESLDCRHLTIFLDDKEVDFPERNSIDCSWSIGETLTIPNSPADSARTIRIVYNSGKRPQELMYADITGWMQESHTPSPTPTYLPTTLPPTPPPTPTSTPGVPLASFNATPRNGPVPLAVQFTDTSTGVPVEWLWTFGDGTTSTMQDPVHTYTEVGSYQVGLAVKNAFGGHTRISQGYITVTPAEERAIYLEAQRGASISPGGFLEFSVTKPGARIKIGGSMVDLTPGARIRLTLDDGGRGKISIRDGSISLFSFDRVVLFLDGMERAGGTAQEIRVPGYENLISSLNLEIEGGSGTIRVLENGVPAPVSSGISPFSLVSLRPDASGIMTLDCYRKDITIFQGAVTGFRSA